MIKKAVLIFLFLIVVCNLSAQRNLREQGDNLNLKIAVMGPGDELYFWWGHIALVIEDTVTGSSNFYDYGIFSFDQENFFLNFAVGRLLYSCGASQTERNLEVYKRTNRSIVMYTLDLPPAKRLEVRDFAKNNILPENRDYLYHHFNDNCSTRIRDIVDLMTDGQFYEQFGEMPGRYTLREHVRRHTWFSPAADWALNFWMGQGIDTPITVWDEMFLPAEVGKRIEDFYYTDSDGVRRKLVTKVETLFEAKNRPIVLDVPKKQWLYELRFSLLLAAIFGFFFFLRAKNLRSGHILSGISMSLCGLIFGFTSLMLYFMAIFTQHDYTYNNINMIFSTPLLLVAVPLGICYAAADSWNKIIRYEALLRTVWLLTVIGIFISMLLKLLPWFWQDNLTDQMLLLPIAIVFSLNPVGLDDVIDRYLRR